MEAGSPTLRARLLAYLPDWVQALGEALVPLLHILLIVVLALALRQLLRRLIRRLVLRYNLPDEFNLGARRGAGFLIIGAALLMVMERLGVSGATLWSAITGFAAVAAVAFFAAWSVLSNMFSAVLVFTTRMFRLGDRIEVLENGDKAGLKGRVIDINLIYTTLHESGEGEHGTVLKVPNSLFFQRVLRLWRSADDGHGGEIAPLPFRPDARPPAPPATEPPAPPP